MTAQISDYGVIGNCRTAALVSKSGSIDWCCFPKFDSEAFFSRLIDPETDACFLLRPDGEFRSRQAYVEDTNILETTFETDSGRVRLTDCISVTQEYKRRHELWPNTEILRILECEQGEENILLRFRPRGDYGRLPVRFCRLGRWGIFAEIGRKILILQSSISTEKLDIHQREGAGEVSAVFRIRAGERVMFSLIFEDEAPPVIPPLGESALNRLSESKNYWRNWIQRCRYHGPYEEEVRRSALALKLLTFAPSGAIVAAPTTSLPEWIGGFRNWDYRFCWIRDASFTVRALVSLGFLEEAHAYVSWLLNATALTHPRLQVVYSVYGEPHLKEVNLEASGFQHSMPVRIGNAASNQFQLDVYGEVLDALSAVVPFLGEIDNDTRSFILDTGKIVSKLWRKPDHGIWEMRLPPQHYTHSKIMAWVALERILYVAREFHWKIDEHEYRNQLAQIRAAIEANSYSESLKSYTQSFGSESLDANVLVMPLVKFCEPFNPRILNTLDAIERKLTKNGLVYRYERGTDGWDLPEGAFGICNFWLAEAHFRSGNGERGKFWLDSILKRRNSVGLWSEQIDPATDTFLGNYPQGFSHVGLINAINALTDCEKGEAAA